MRCCQLIGCQRPIPRAAVQAVHWDARYHRLGMGTQREARRLTDVFSCARPVAVLTVCYGAVRILLALSVPVYRHPDSASYQVAPSFIGAHSRPWVVPLTYQFVDGRGVVAFQAALSAAAFVALALAIASTMIDRRVRVGVMSAVLLLGLAPRVTVWDASLTSESIALSLTALLLAALTWINRLPGWALVLVFTLWLFARDAHVYLGVLVFVSVLPWAWRHRRYAVVGGMGVALAWAALATQNDDTIESYNVTLNIAWHAGRDPEMFRWFVEQGMPPSNAFGNLNFDGRQAELLNDSRFFEWARTDGPSTYTRYLATHPGFTLSAFNSVFGNGGADAEAMVDSPKLNIGESPVGPWFVWPREASLYTVVLTLLAAGALLIGRRPVIPIVMLASTLPHALLVYHGSPWELARHSVVLSFVLVVSSCWLIADAVDATFSRPPDPSLTRD